MGKGGEGRVSYTLVSQVKYNLKGKDQFAKKNVIISSLIRLEEKKENLKEKNSTFSQMIMPELLCNIKML